MIPLRLYNTLTHSIEPFVAGNPPEVSMYTCGPTVYRPVHIGNLRSYLMADWLRRTFVRSGYLVRQVVNITDVGHMRQDQLDLGEDKVVAAALAEGRSPAEIAAHYTALYRNDLERLRILPAAVNPRASDHIPEMTALIERLLERGYAYLAGSNVYYNVASFESYGVLSGNVNGTELEEAVRIQADPDKRDPRDFALWKGAEPGRTLQWPSPWGPGFPGWHIECSAMAIKHLGETLDLHTGGVDNIFPHHEDERAQSEAATGRRFAGHWVHGQHLLVDGLKMAKSSGNAYTLDDLQNRGFDPLSFRYLCLSAHYRHRLNFSFAALRAAQRGLAHLRGRVQNATPKPDTTWSNPWVAAFEAALADDLNLPAALAALWRMLHAPGDEAAKVAILLDADQVLGLGLNEAHALIPTDQCKALISQRQALRHRGDYTDADRLRDLIREQGFELRDTVEGSYAVALPSPESGAVITRSDEIPSLLHEPDLVETTIGIVVTNALDDLRRCVESVLCACDGASFELLVVDNGSIDGTSAWLAERMASEPRLRVVVADHNLGEGAGRNAIFKRARGSIVVIVDTSIEFTGDPLPALRDALAKPGIGAAGAYGLVTDDLRCFEATEETDVDALEGYLFAMRRALLPEIELMDEKYRFYRNLDIDYSYQIRNHGYLLVRVPGLPLVVHPHRIWNSLGEEQREALSKKNFNRFLHRWRERTDLLRLRRPVAGD